MDSLLELFCNVDDFCQKFEPAWEKRLLSSGECQRQRERRLTLSELMTIVIHFHQSQYRNFKAYYKECVLKHLRAEFPNLVSYSRFVEFMPSALIPLSVFLCSACFENYSGISFINSTALDVCHNHRIAQHRVFESQADRGKTLTGWFFGFKLHLVVNDRGEILNVMLTPGNVDDRKLVPELVRNLFDNLVGGLIAYCRQPKKPSLGFYSSICLLP